MSEQHTKYIYTVGEDVPRGTIILCDDEFVFPATQGDVRVPIGVLERDFKQGERVLYDPSGDSEDISHAILRKGLPYSRKGKDA